MSAGRPLSHRDFGTLLDFVAEMRDRGDVHALRAWLLERLPRLVSAEVATLFEIDRLRGTICWVTRPDGAFDFPDSQRVLATYMGESPLFRAYRRGEGPAVRLSDFVAPRRFRRSPLYNEFYRRVGLEYQLTKGLP